INDVYSCSFMHTKKDSFIPHIWYIKDKVERMIKMNRSQFTYTSSDQRKINAYSWQPEDVHTIKAIVQLSHGMAEHIQRYDAFSQFLTQNGFVVYGNDHRGHGQSVTAPDDRGYFAEKNGFELVVDDMFRLTAIAKNAYPDVPVFIFGHSMGSFLTQNGFVVYGNDHRGHGQSVTAPDDRGYFAEKNGFELVVDDMFRLTAIAKNAYPDVPVFIFGHSMGSFLTRRYMVKYGKHINGVVLSGTGGDHGCVGKIGLQLANLEKRRIGARTPSKLLDKLIFGNFNKFIPNARTPF